MPSTHLIGMTVLSVIAQANLSHKTQHARSDFYLVTPAERRVAIMPMGVERVERQRTHACRLWQESRGRATSRPIASMHLARQLWCRMEGAETRILSQDLMLLLFFLAISGSLRVPCGGAYC